jgi:hypothetical protein
MAFGAGPGLAGGLSIASVAINLLIKNWSKLTELFGSSAVKTAAEEMEELRKKTALTADEADRLQRLQALPEKTKEIQQGKTEEQQKTEAAVTRAIVEAGPREVAAGVLRTNPGLVDSRGDAAKVAEELRKAEAELQSLMDSNNTSEAGGDPNAIPEAQKRITDLKIQQ